MYEISKDVLKRSATVFRLIRTKDKFRSLEICLEESFKVILKDMEAKNDRQ